MYNFMTVARRTDEPDRRDHRQRGDLSDEDKTRLEIVKRLFEIVPEQSEYADHREQLAAAEGPEQLSLEMRREQLDASRGIRRGSGVVAHPAKPPSVVAAPRLCRSCTFPLGPARVPRRKDSQDRNLLAPADAR